MPANHKVKVVVFGRGTGEAILIEISANEWIAVDCFNHPKEKKPAAISYLEKKGIDPKVALKKIIITHFHEDHIKGMLEMIKAASDNCNVYISQALTAKEAFEYYSNLNVLHDNPNLSGVSELCNITNYMDSLNRSVIKVKQDQVIYNNDNYQITAIAPSEFDSQKSQEKFISLLSKTEDGVIPQAAKINPNHFCIVLNISCKKTNKNIVLGADLEICPSPEGGWNSAMSSVMAPAHNSIQVMKIPHHGSCTGFHEKTWEDHVEKDAISILTTFDKSNLPRAEYINLYKKYTNNLLSTTIPKERHKKDILNRAALKIIATKSPSVNIRSATPAVNYGYIETTKGEHNFQYSLHGNAIAL